MSHGKSVLVLFSFVPWPAMAATNVGAGVIAVVITALVFGAVGIGAALVFVRRWHAARHGAAAAQSAAVALQSLIAATPMVMVAWHARDGVVGWNAAAERLFGITRDKALGLPLPGALAPLRAAVETALAGGDVITSLPVVVVGNWGGILRLSVSAARSDDDRAATVTTIIEDVTSPRLQEASRVDSVRVQRDALIREVHHRIKNHLQGVAGLLRQHLAGKPLLQPLLEAATAQVLTIAAVHGLQGEIEDSQVDLRSFVARIAASISGIMHVPIVLGDSCRQMDGLCVSEDESVPVAMVLNEVLMNAVKHRLRRDGESMVRVDAARDGNDVLIRISNAGFLPPRFDFQTGTQVGNGLGLVRSLLPQQGAMLDIVEDGERVVATLSLSAPNIIATSTTSARAHAEHAI